MADYTLPDLDWDYGALEPHISGEINELHHSKHHAAYVKGVNDAVAKLEEARANDDHGAILLNEKNLAFHLGGHVNHSIWWKNLSPNGGDKPTGELAAAILVIGRLVGVADEDPDVLLGHRRGMLPQVADVGERYSSLQAGSQPSLALLLPSSHSSTPTCSRPSPHLASTQVLVH